MYLVLFICEKIYEYIRRPPPCWFQDFAHTISQRVLYVRTYSIVFSELPGTRNSTTIYTYEWHLVVHVAVVGFTSTHQNLYRLLNNVK